MLTKQRVVMHMDGPINFGEQIEFTEDAAGDQKWARTVRVDVDDWAEMGEPQVLTVTWEPGDLLNDDPISR